MRIRSLQTILPVILLLFTSGTGDEGIRIGKQTWMNRNLEVEQFSNGTRIKQAKTEDEWLDAGAKGEPVWCYYEFDDKLGKPYGKLYNWYAVSHPSGLAPSGWRIPEVDDYLKLMEEFGGKDSCALVLKNTDGWSGRKKGNGSNASGFSALPGGMVDDAGWFGLEGYFGGWWTASTDSTGKPVMVGLDFAHTGATFTSEDKSFGYAVRCIQGK
ncbi:MAG: fibrobacter succinogenes major paralogous domain-containing protein [Chitinophagales bacterium]|nr:fibrobacter succinogenes major paralogous domain-containing protein [Chitinophagales bacterium]HAE12890.1 hypothetical protein [Bacteroidota bacterium]MCB9020822.1 fibrobacter succinogenes major paralogous domain-containing protein [Chitinophagales bacterium]MCB9031260.1 fibrobacter succinogenes major paralogous domain-containing protein [Chitinophagales bacterium]HAE35643.1 hypothetical protein [Bacteroidota bacterium]